MINFWLITASSVYSHSPLGHVSPHSQTISVGKISLVPGLEIRLKIRTKINSIFDYGRWWTQTEINIIDKNSNYRASLD